MPRVSVLLPCRDAEATVDEALASLHTQSLDDIEIVVVDDGSTDGTAGRLAHWAARDRRIVVLRTAPRGIVAALESAVEVARADMFARMDADDIAAPERLDKQLDYLDTHPSIAVCGTLVQYTPRHRVRDGARRYERWVNSVVSNDDVERDLFVECPIPHPSLMVRRSAYEAVGGYRDRGWPEDYDLILRLWTGGYRFGKVPEVLLRWRERPERLSRTDRRYEADAFRRCKAHFLPHRTGGRPVVVWGAGPVGKAFARALRRADQHVAAFVDLDPRKIGQIIHDAPVVHPSAIGQYRAAYPLAAVGSAGGRAEIRSSLRAAGFREPMDFCAVA